MHLAVTGSAYPNPVSNRHAQFLRQRSQTRNWRLKRLRYCPRTTQPDRWSRNGGSFPSTVGHPAGRVNVLQPRLPAVSSHIDYLAYAFAAIVALVPQGGCWPPLRFTSEFAPDVYAEKGCSSPFVRLSM